MKTFTAKQKLVCPYCKCKQKSPAIDYFPSHCPNNYVSTDINCTHCDRLFDAVIFNDKEEVFAYPVKQH